MTILTLSSISKKRMHKLITLQDWTENSFIVGPFPTWATILPTERDGDVSFFVILCFLHQSFEKEKTKMIFNFQI